MPPDVLKLIMAGDVVDWARVKSPLGPVIYRPIRRKDCYFREGVSGPEDRSG
jgi:hypothetical protein